MALLPPLSRWRIWLGVAAMTLGLALAAQQLIPALYRPSSAPDAQPLQSADPAIRLTEVGNGMVVVYADITGARDAADNFDKTAATVSAVGQALEHGVSDNLGGAKTVRFSIRCQAVNRLGQDVMAQLVAFDAPVQALETVDYAKTRPADVLGLAEHVKLGAPGAYDAIAAWCADPARAGKAFCGKANS
jgi:hypothetical protein